MSRDYWRSRRRDQCDIFPGSVWYSIWGRLLNVGLLGICILFGTKILAWTGKTLQTLLYPQALPTKTSFHIFTVSVLVSVIICATLQKLIVRSLNRIGLNTLMPWAKVFVTGALIAVVMHYVIYALWRWRYRATSREISLTWFSLNRRASFASLGITIIAFGWIGMNQLAVATTMTRNFSQRGLLNQYEHTDTRWVMHHYLPTDCQIVTEATMREISIKWT